MRFYSMKNRYSDTFNTPFPASTDAEAIYQIRLVINQKREPEIIAEDFALYFVGDFSEKFGFFRSSNGVNEEHLILPICLIEDCSVLRVKKEGGEDA